MMNTHRHTSKHAHPHSLAHKHAHTLTRLVTVCGYGLLKWERGREEGFEEDEENEEEEEEEQEGSGGGLGCFSCGS